ncbi:hypothetical protein FACS189419_09420 [Planctomycetales bacterium]|nr:hypothetical protein FACS189419_09420 [Planctomycetales bacterium]
MSNMLRFAALVAFFVLQVWVYSSNVVCAQQQKAADSTDSYNKEAYEKNLKLYYSIVATYKRADEESRKNNKALARAKYWLEKEQKGTSGEYRQIELAFTKGMSKEVRSKYRKWQRGFVGTIAPAIYEKEWNTNPDSRDALFFFFDMEWERQKEIALDNHLPSANEYEVELPKDNEERFFFLFNKKKQKDAELVAAAPQLAKELNVPQKLQDLLAHRIKETALFDVYKVYVNFHSPKHLEQMKEQINLCIDTLNKIRPRWEVYEGIESDEEMIYGLGLQSVDWTMKHTFLTVGTIAFIIGVIFICRCTFPETKNHHKDSTIDTSADADSNKEEKKSNEHDGST